MGLLASFFVKVIVDGFHEMAQQHSQRDSVDPHVQRQHNDIQRTRYMFLYMNDEP
jgi:hypothetical protein